jgi:hypothetical protein
MRMELRVRSWSRSGNRPATVLKRANLQAARIDEGITWEQVSIRPVAGRKHPKFGHVFPVRSVKIDFGMNLDNLHGDYFTTLQLGLEDVALLYQLCFEHQTVATAALVLGRAAESLDDMFRHKGLITQTG